MTNITTIAIRESTRERLEEKLARLRKAGIKASYDKLVNQGLDAIERETK